MRVILKPHIILLIIPLIILSSCGATLFAANSSGGSPTSLQVSRTNSLPENHYPSFSPRTISDQQKIQQLYERMQALPHLISGTRPCPIGSSLKYTLDFFQGHTLLQEAMYRPGGCAALLIGKDDARIPDKSFAQSLAQTLGVSEKELFPVPLVTCTPKSPCPSPTP